MRSRKNSFFEDRNLPERARERESESCSTDAHKQSHGATSHTVRRRTHQGRGTGWKAEKKRAREEREEREEGRGKGERGGCVCVWKGGGRREADRNMASWGSTRLRAATITIAASTCPLQPAGDRERALQGCRVARREGGMDG
eukprot:2056716-Rhodomonas_salina.1